LKQNVFASNGQESEDQSILKKTFGLLLSTRALIFLIAFLSLQIIEKSRWFKGSTDVFQAFFTWDSQWFGSVFTLGYQYNPAAQSNIAFFPLYPLVTKIVSLFTEGIIGSLMTGYLVSNLSLFFAGFFLYKLVQLEFKSKEISNKVLFLFFISPLSFFFSIVYSEGLFLLLIISSFYYARKKNWKNASLLGFLAALTRASGVLLIIPLLIEYFTDENNNFKFKMEKIKKDILYIFAVPMGLASYFMYLFILFGSPFVYFKNQVHWQRWLTNPFQIFTNIQSYPPFYQILFLGAIIVGIILVFILYKSKVRPSYTFYSAALIISYMSTNLAESIPRYFSTIFPLYIALALISQKNDLAYKTITIFSVSLLTLLTIMFVNGYWLT